MIFYWRPSVCGGTQALDNHRFNCLLSIILDHGVRGEPLSFGTMSGDAAGGRRPASGGPSMDRMSRSCGLPAITRRPGLRCAYGLGPLVPHQPSPSVIKGRLFRFVCRVVDNRHEANGRTRALSQRTVKDVFKSNNAAGEERQLRRAYFGRIPWGRPQRVPPVCPSPRPSARAVSIPEKKSPACGRAMRKHSERDETLASGSDRHQRRFALSQKPNFAPKTTENPRDRP
jgi:hypothetical protein